MSCLTDNALHPGIPWKTEVLAASDPKIRVMAEPLWRTWYFRAPFIRDTVICGKYHAAPLS